MTILQYGDRKCAINVSSAKLKKKNPRLFNEIVAHGLDPDQNQFNRDQGHTERVMNIEK